MDMRTMATCLLVLAACDAGGQGAPTSATDTAVATDTTVVTTTTSTATEADASTTTDSASGETTVEDTTVTTPDTPDTTTAPNPTGQRLTFATEEITIQPGSERQVCKYVNIPAGAGVDVVRIESRMSGKSHHFNLYKVIDGTKLNPVSESEAQTRDCAPANEQLGGDAAYIYGSATPDRVMETPAGVAYHLEGGQRLILEYHGINYTTEAQTGAVEVDLVLAAPEAVIDHHADIMWMANWSFFLPKGQETSSTKSCAVPYDVDVFSLMSHFHELGTHFTIETVIDGEATLVYEDDDWAHPKVEVFDPPMKLKQGDRIRWTCTWFNWRDVGVGPNKDSTDEMCMVFAAAFPSNSKSEEPWQCNIIF